MAKRSSKKRTVKNAKKYRKNTENAEKNELNTQTSATIQKHPAKQSGNVKKNTTKASRGKSKNVVKFTASSQTNQNLQDSKNLRSKKHKPSGKLQSKTSKPTLLDKIRQTKHNIKAWRAQRVRLHRSFKRSYREDYYRETKTPGLLSHAMTTFQFLFRHWRVFLPLVGLMVILYIVLVGLMAEDFYTQFQDNIDETSAELATGEIGNFAKAGLLLLATVTTGGLNEGMGEVETLFMIILLLITWLVTLFLMRHFYAGSKPRLRDALYNSMTPLISTMLIFGLIILQSIPIMLVVITYSAAVSTGFLATPFYALVYFIFAAVMMLLSAYMLASSLMALVIVTVPGIYPLQALASASDLMAGRRTRFLWRLVYLIFVVAIIYIIMVLPVILLDLILKNAITWLEGWPIVPLSLLITTCYVFIYITAYIYRYYRYLVDGQNGLEKSRR